MAFVVVVARGSGCTPAVVSMTPATVSWRATAHLVMTAASRATGERGPSIRRLRPRVDAARPPRRRAAASPILKEAASRSPGRRRAWLPPHAFLWRCAALLRAGAAARLLTGPAPPRPRVAAYLPSAAAVGSPRVALRWPCAGSAGGAPGPAWPSRGRGPRRRRRTLAAVPWWPLVAAPSLSLSRRGLALPSRRCVRLVRVLGFLRGTRNRERSLSDGLVVDLSRRRSRRSSNLSWPRVALRVARLGIPLPQSRKRAWTLF